MKLSTLIPAIVIPVLAVITGVIIIPAYTDSLEVEKDCENQEIIVNETANGVEVYISCLPAKGGIVTGNRTVEYVD